MLKFKDFLLRENKSNSDPQLKEDFDYLNELLFDNQVKEVPIDYFNSKTKAGLMIMKNGEISIKITKFFELSKQQRLSILAHEMIHALMVQNGIKDNNDHGRTFMKIVDELNKKQDEFVISKSEMLSDFKPTSKNKKEVGAIVFKMNDDLGAVFVNKEIINDRKLLNDFCDQMKQYVKHPMNVFKKDKNLILEFWKSDDPYLSKFKIKRTLNLRSLELNGISANDLKTIETGKKLFECKIK
jgi:predicted SprT family Zn-dependent metalloprotease